jgi:hypothetical protein
MTTEKGTVICFNCQTKGHMAKHCRKPKRRFPKPGLTRDITGNNNCSGKRIATIGEQQPTNSPVFSVCCIGDENSEFVELPADISKEGKLRFLIDTGADISLLKGNALVESTEYDPEGRLRVRCVDGTPITLGVIEAAVRVDKKLCVHGCQLDKQVDIPCDGILVEIFSAQTGDNMLRNAHCDVEWGKVYSGK